ncbi:hypothetical protein [Actinoalloteichus spitiensis]|uniref:hypothetical protein n=1 Tax=Actinoalloteichus spitiensis TaxID=252394 RepID=UPI00037F379C|nr:hypothetical protein [Actinoalloteichus spitiensis]
MSTPTEDEERPTAAPKVLLAAVGVVTATAFATIAALGSDSGQLAEPEPVNRQDVVVRSDFPQPSVPPSPTPSRSSAPSVPPSSSPSGSAVPSTVEAPANTQDETGVGEPGGAEADTGREPGAPHQPAPNPPPGTGGSGSSNPAPTNPEPSNPDTSDPGTGPPPEEPPGDGDGGSPGGGDDESGPSESSDPGTPSSSGASLPALSTGPAAPGVDGPDGH